MHLYRLHSLFAMTCVSCVTSCEKVVLCLRADGREVPEAASKWAQEENWMGGDAVVLSADTAEVRLESHGSASVTNRWSDVDGAHNETSHTRGSPFCTGVCRKTTKFWHVGPGVDMIFTGEFSIRLLLLALTLSESLGGPPTARGRRAPYSLALTW